MTMNLMVNDQPRELAEGASVADLLRALELHERRVAVMVNGAVVRRAQHAAHRLTSGDRVDIVQMVGGG